MSVAGSRRFRVSLPIPGLIQAHQPLASVSSKQAKLKLGESALEGDGR